MRRSKDTFLASRNLWLLKQGKRSMALFVVALHTLAAESEWNDPSLKGAFYNALIDRLKD